MCVCVYGSMHCIGGPLCFIPSSSQTTLLYCKPWRVEFVCMAIIMKFVYLIMHKKFAVDFLFTVCIYGPPHQHQNQTFSNEI